MIKGDLNAVLAAPAGRYVENHGVIHNMWFNTTTGQKKAYYDTLHVDEWWDNGTLPIWITAQRQVCEPVLGGGGVSGGSPW